MTRFPSWRRCFGCRFDGGQQVDKINAWASFDAQAFLMGT